jgi:hypothetical protein
MPEARDRQGLALSESQGRQWRALLSDVLRWPRVYWATRTSIEGETLERLRSELRQARGATRPSMPSR